MEQGEMVKACLPLLHLSPPYTPQAKIKLKSSIVPRCKDMGSSSAESKSDPKKLSTSTSLQELHQIRFTALCFIYSFVQLCVSECACMCVGVYTWNRKVEKGLRRQPLAWELRGPSREGGVDFINRLSQHSGSGCRGDAECGTETDGRRMRSTSASFHFNTRAS